MGTRPIRLQFRVSPGAGRSVVIGRHGDAWKIRVAAVPERGRANAGVVDLLAASLAIERPGIRIVSGATSRNKIVELDGLTVEEAEQRLTAAQEGRVR